MINESLSRRARAFLSCSFASWRDRDDGPAPWPPPPPPWAAQRHSVTASLQAVMKRPAAAVVLVASCAVLLPSLHAMVLPHRVAILGSGISGSTAARKLAEAGVKVSVFECGFGVGGRTSTRTTRDECKFAFDHGAQYIGSPKTELFRSALSDWQSNGFVREWKGRVANIDASGIIHPDDDGGNKKTRYVGYPAMNSICSNLLKHENIDIVLQTRACATYNQDDCKWTLTSHDDGRDLGQFDWLIGGDRLSATNNRADLRHAPLHEFRDEVEQIASVPILVLMLAFDSPLHIPYDGITFDEESGEFGSLGWIARDTSKPGRERDDGKECWVIQSGSKAAERVLASITESDFETKRVMVREKAKQILLDDFLAAIPKLSASDDSPTPHITSAVGHRWSAAFPSVTEANQEKECFFNIDHRFIGCGDYMGKLTGRIEGAYLSGNAAASALLDTVQNKDEL